MKKSETATIVTRLMTVYPSFKFGVNPLTGEDATLENVVDVWHSIIGDMEYVDADRAVASCINRCKFVPSIAEIREEYDAISYERRKSMAEVKEYYNRSRNSYPTDVPYDYGWEEWKSRAADGQTARTFYDVIMQYLNECIRDGKDAIDFRECVKSICRDNDGRVFFK